MATVSDAIEKIVSETDKIQEVVRAPSGNEYFFRFANRFFSVLARSDPEQAQRLGDYSFYVYPTWQRDLASLANSGQLADHELVAYDGNDLPARTGVHLARLYKVLEEKIHNLPGLFDEVLNS